MRKYSLFYSILILFLVSLTLTQLDFFERFGLIPSGFSLTKGNDDLAELGRLDRFSRAMYYVGTSYVDPERIDPNQMLKEILNTLSDQIPEVQTAFATSSSVFVWVNSKQREFDTRVSNLHGLKVTIADVLKFIKSNMVSDFSNDELEITAINAALSTLDPHSTFLSKEIYKETLVETSGHFGGLGIVIGIRDNKLTVIAPVQDTPAYKAGIKAGDHITKIGQEITQNMLLSDAVKRLRGPVGTSIAITFMRVGFEKEKTLTLIRANIDIASVDSSLLDQQVGYVKIKNFQKNTDRDLENHLSELKKQNGDELKGLILDLRSNPGGVLDQAIAVADHFINDGVIVTTVGLNNRVREEEKATKRNTQINYPMVVLVDEGSASASEIVAGALKEHKRALILGRQTFGKGTVQRLLELPNDSALKLTIAKYLTPGDISIQSVGIVPNVLMTPAILTDKYFNLFQSEEHFGEASLEHHFKFKESGNIKKSTPDFSMSYVYENKEGEPDGLISLGDSQTDRIKKLKKDFEVNLAKRIILQTSSSAHSDMFLAAKNVVEIESALEDQKLIRVLSTKNIDWSSENSNCEKSVVIKSSTTSPVHANDKIKLNVTVKNNSSCTIDRLWIESESKQYFLDKQESIVGLLKAGQETQKTFEFQIPKFQPESIAKVSFKLNQNKSDTPLSKTETSFNIHAQKSPLFTFSYIFIKQTTQASIDQDSYMLKVKINNLGETSSSNSSISVRAKGTQDVNFTQSHASLANLESQKEKTVEFAFNVKRFSSPLPNLTLALEISDYDYRVFQLKNIEVDLREKIFVSQVFNPPLIKSNLDVLNESQLNQSAIDLTGEVADDIELKDMFVLVNRKKVFYENFQKVKNKKSNFKTKLSLEKGENIITNVARDHNDLLKSHRIVITQ